MPKKKFEKTLTLSPVSATAIFEKSGKSDLSQKPSEEWLPNIDATIIEIVENYPDELTDELFFELLFESPHYLMTKTFQERIELWQEILFDSLVSAEEKKEAKYRLACIGSVLSYESPGRPKEHNDSMIHLEYISRR